MNLNEIKKTVPHYQYIEKEIKITGLAWKKEENGDLVLLKKDFIDSCDRRFHTALKSLKDVIGNASFDNLLIIMKDGQLAKIYYKFPLSMNCLASKTIQTGNIVFDKDILDISTISFSDQFDSLNPENGDKIIWVFRIGFLFGLYFDFTGELNAKTALKEMGKSYNLLYYYDYYLSLEKDKIENLISRGWFPFICLRTSQIQYLIEHETEISEKWLDTNFSNNIIEEMTNAWYQHPIFSKKLVPLKEGVDCFLEKKYSASISTLFPLIEGLIAEAYKEEKGENLGFSDKDIISSVSKHALCKCSEFPKAFPELFQEYLKEFIYKHGMNEKNLKTATRHTTVHGRVEDSAFTQERAVQLILTLEQIFYYL